jgi:hypothetical protein
MSYCIPPPKRASKIKQLKIAPSLVLWGLLGIVTVTRSGRLPRLRRAAHKHFRRGPCWSPCPRLRLAGSTPSGDFVPHCLAAAAPPFGSPIKGFFEKSFSSRPRRGKEERGVAGDLLANRSTLPQPPRGRNACYGVLREGCTVESNLCPARRRRGKRALLVWSVRCRRGWNGHCGRVKRLSGDWG